MEASKKCTQCRVEKHLEEFYRRKDARDGRQFRCKDCAKAYFSAWAAKPEAKALAKGYNRKYNQSAKGKTRVVAYRLRPEKKARLARQSKAYREKYPEKKEAHGLLNCAIRAGKLTRPNSCSSCDATCTPDGHHTDYSKPLDVIWLCRTCHTKAHL